MALFKFTRSILEGEPLTIYNYGDMKRDFTYIDDVIQAIMLLIDCVPAPSGDGEQREFDNLSPVAPFRMVNIGNSAPVQLTDFIEAIEEATQKTAVRQLMAMQPGDVPATWADTSVLSSLTGYRPQTTIKEGVARFVEWYREYYNC